MKVDKSIIKVENLNISFGQKEILNNISFNVPQGKILGIVGESGSGKSITAMAIMGLLSQKSLNVSGTILFNDKELLKMTSNEIRKLRSTEIAMIFQEPLTALNPSLSCGEQVAELLTIRLQKSKKQAKEEVLKLFEKVKLPRPKYIYNSYPHQISGGQMQRVMIAMAISCKPKLLIADEPTTALDVTVQKEIIQLLKAIQKETEMSMIFISHDLALVSEIADSVVVMNKGIVEEQGSVFEIFKLPKKEYTKALLASRPPLNKRLKKLPTIKSLADNSFSIEEISLSERALNHKNIYLKNPILEIKNLEKEYFQNSGILTKRHSIKAVNGVSFSVYPGETLGLVGESGCGKSTLGKVILQLENATKGQVYFRGKDITKLSAKEVRKLRKDIQLIFQDPYSSLNPRLSIGQAIVEVMQVHNIGKTKRQREIKVVELLERVGLGKDYFNRYPHELSGGQRQRVGIARTIALEPKLVICDESVSALDISVQAQVLNLLNELKEDYGFTYIFISHDLAVVKFMADQLLVMNQGIIEELGEADEIYANPSSQYTKKLIEAIPKGI